MSRLSEPCSPTTALAVLCLVQIAVWTIVPALIYAAPPLDVVESLMWGREWVIGTYKHPALPAWILETARLLTGSVLWAPFLVSQIFLAVTFITVYGLGLDLFGRQASGARRAAAGTLVLPLSFFFSWPTVEFNHTIAQLPLWTGFLWAFWRAIAGGGALRWSLAGLVGAIGLYAKLSGAIVIIVAALYLLFEPQARRSLLTRDPWVGLSVGLLVAFPLFGWLYSSDFEPMRYAAERSKFGGYGPIAFLALILALEIPVAAGLLLARPASSERLPSGLAAEARPREAERRALVFLTAVLFGPLLLATLVASVISGNVRPSWGAPMLSIAGLFLVAATGLKVAERGVERLVYLAVGVIGAAAAMSSAIILFDVGAKARIARPSWPEREISERLSEAWSKATQGQPLKIVAGDAWNAGLVALIAPGHPSILTDGDLKHSPWITPERLKREGALAVWEKRELPSGETSTFIAPELLALIGDRKREEMVFSAVGGRSARKIVLGCAILPPARP